MREEELLRFHSSEYIEYLKQTGHIDASTHQTFNHTLVEQQTHNQTIDCPLFDGVL